MKSFDPSFKTFPDYIINITQTIWENRALHTLNRYYAQDIIVRSPAGITRGNQSVIADTMATLAAFPDRTLLGEDVIWCGTSETGMLSSHRIYSTATHQGHGLYGSPTGRSLAYRIIADCHAKDNQIDDEWIIRDQGAIVQQLGHKPKDYAQHLIEQAGGKEQASRPFLPENDIPGPYQGQGNDNLWGTRLADLLTQIMAGDLSVIPSYYDRAAHLHYPNGQNSISHAAADHFWMGLRASFPEAIFTIHHVIGMDDPLMPPRASIRWSLDGFHTGWGRFGQPTQARVYIMGISQVEFGHFGAHGWSVRREYTLFDEVAVWQHILMHHST